MIKLKLGIEVLLIKNLKHIESLKSIHKAIKLTQINITNYKRHSYLKKVFIYQIL